MIEELKLIMNVIDNRIENIKSRLNELEKSGEPLNGSRKMSLQGEICGLCFALGAVKESIITQEARRDGRYGVCAETTTD